MLAVLTTCKNNNKNTDHVQYKNDGVDMRPKIIWKTKENHLLKNFYKKGDFLRQKKESCACTWDSNQGTRLQNHPGTESVEKMQRDRLGASLSKRWEVEKEYQSRDDSGVGARQEWDWNTGTSTHTPTLTYSNPLQFEALVILFGHYTLLNLIASSSDRLHWLAVKVFEVHGFTSTSCMTNSAEGTICVFPESKHEWKNSWLVLWQPQTHLTEAGHGKKGGNLYWAFPDGKREGRCQEWSMHFGSYKYKSGHEPKQSWSPIWLWGDSMTVAVVHTFLYNCGTMRGEIQKQKS